MISRLFYNFSTCRDDVGMSIMRAVYWAFANSFISR